MNKTRNFTTYIFLNALTLGIYGLVTKCQIGQEINNYCGGDGQQPKYGYFASALLSIFSGGAYLEYWWYNQTKRLYVNGERYGLMIRETPLQQFAWRMLSSGGSFLTVLVAAVLSPVTGIFTFVFDLYASILEGFGSYFSLIFSFITEIFNAFGIADLFTGDIASVFNMSNVTMTSATTNMFEPIPAVGFPGGGLVLFLGILGAYLVLFLAVLFSSFDMYYVLKVTNRFAAASAVVAPTAYNPMSAPEADNKNNIFNRAVEILDNIDFETVRSWGSGSSAGTTVDPRLEQTVRSLQNEVYMLEKQIKEIKPVERPQVNSSDIPNEKYTKVICKGGSNRGAELKISSERELIIGKDPALCHFVIASSYKAVSRKHCGLRYDKKGDRYFITDYSTNGTFVNGKQLPQNQTVAIQKGVVLRLGDTDNEFLLQ